METTDEFVTIKTFDHPGDMAVIRARLESEGIECFVINELATQLYPIINQSIGGIKLEVRKSDAAAAMEIMKEAGMEPDA